MTHKQFRRKWHVAFAAGKSTAEITLEWLKGLKHTPKVEASGGGGGGGGGGGFRFISFDGAGGSNVRSAN